MVEEKIMKLLEDNGYEVYYVGGYVRDSLLGIEGLDKDLVTNASIEKMLEIFSGKFHHIDEVGKRFGVLLVDGIEVAQYRKEVYRQRMKPEVMLTGNLEEDSSRRDFTINALYMRRDGLIVDPQNGVDDLRNKVIRAVGNPRDRYEEDPSRILRGVYLAAKLGFYIEENTAKAMTENRHLLGEVPDELKGKIVSKSIKSGTFYDFVKKLMGLKLMEGLFPELVHLEGLPQNGKYHKYDAWNHTLEVLKTVEKKRVGEVSFILGALFHDVAKGLEGVRGVNKEGYPNDIGHEKVGGPIAERVVLRLGLGKQVAKKVRFFVEQHGVRFEKDMKDKTVIKWLRKLAKESKDINELRENVYELMDFIDSDADGFNDFLKSEVKDMLKVLKVKVDKALEEVIFYVNQLPVDGRDVMSFGVKGKEIGEILNRLVMLNVRDKKKAEELIKNYKRKG